MFRQLQLFGLRHRLERLDGTLDQLQARYSIAKRVDGDFAAQRLQHEFDNLAITRAIVAHRLDRLNGMHSMRPDTTVRRAMAAAHSAPGAL
jgi:hypothetical protein